MLKMFFRAMAAEWIREEERDKDKQMGRKTGKDAYVEGEKNRV